MKSSALVILPLLFVAIICSAKCAPGSTLIKENDLNSTVTAYDHSNLSTMSFTTESKLIQPMPRNVYPDSYFCGQLIGGHYMFGSASSYCGGYTIRDCSAQCFYRNFTFFQCEGLVCHCYN